MIFSEDKDRQRGFNDATLDLKTNRNQIPTNGNSNTNPNGNNGVVCSASALQSMGNRLLDWFSVVMADSKKRRTHNKSKGNYNIISVNTLHFIFFSHRCRFQNILILHA